jgi:hypothetical protein
MRSEGDSDTCNGERAGGGQPDPDVPSSDPSDPHWDREHSF